MELAWRRALALAMLGGVAWLAPGREAAAQEGIRPYALHEIRLGTTLTQLRKLYFLDDEEQDHLRLICSIDPEGAHVVLLDTVRIGEPGAVRCALFERGPDPALKPGKIRIFGELIQPTLLLYKAERDSDYRLAQIGATLQSDRFTEVVTLMRQTYGPPTTYDMTNVETSEGDLGNADWYWSNGVSSARAELLALDLDHMALTFTYDTFLRDIQNQERGRTGP